MLVSKGASTSFFIPVVMMVVLVIMTKRLAKVLLLLILETSLTQKVLSFFKNKILKRDTTTHSTENAVSIAFA